MRKKCCLTRFSSLFKLKIGLFKGFSVFLRLFTDIYGFFSFLLITHTLLCISSWTCRNTSFVTIAGWLSSMKYWGSSPLFFLTSLVRKSAVYVFCQSTSPQYFSLFKILHIVLELHCCMPDGEGTSSFSSHSLIPRNDTPSK